MLANKHTAVLYLRRLGFECYVLDQDKVLFFVFPEEAVRHLDVLSSGVYEAAALAFIKEQLPHPLEVIILLSEEVLFHKAFPNLTDEAMMQTIQRFLDQVPIAPETAIQTKQPIQDQMHYAVVNNQLYKPVVDVIRQLGKTEAVLGVWPAFLLGGEWPLAAFGQQASLTMVQVSAATKQLSSLKTNDLLLKEYLASPVAIEKKQRFEKKQLVGAAIFVVCAVLLLLGVGFVYFRSIPKKPIPPVILPADLQPVDTTQPVVPPIDATKSSDASASAAPITRSTARISIQNGSGVAGQAGVIKDRLSSFGYTVFTVGNATPPLPSQPALQFAPAVPADIRQELTTQLQQLFPNLSVVEKTDLTTFDIVMITVK